MVRTRVAALAVSALAIVAGCSAGGHAPAAQHTAGLAGSTPHSATPPTRAGNRAAAEALTRRLVTMMPLPAGATRLVHAPAGAPEGPAMGTPVSDDYLDVTTYWRVPLPTSQLRTWVDDHAPAGFTNAGGGSATGPGLSQVGVAFDAPADPAAPQNELGQLSVTATPAGTDAAIWRIDGSDLWYDPTPTPVRPGGVRLHVSVASGCPTSLGKATDVSNTAAGVKTTLLPAAAPTGALVCAYRSFRGPLSQGPQVLDAAQAAKVAAQARALPLGSTHPGPHGCTEGSDKITVLAFAYPAGEVDLWWQVDGCAFVDNGVIRSPAGGLSLPH